jgi:hypothetical protein
VGVKDSELVVCGDVDKSYLRVVEDGVIIDGLDPVESNIVEDLFDVVFRCGVADIVELQKEDMATARGKLESIGSEERHLDGAKGGVVYWNGEMSLEWQWKTDSRQVRVDCEPFQADRSNKKLDQTKIGCRGLGVVAALPAVPEDLVVAGIPQVCLSVVCLGNFETQGLGAYIHSQKE